jgi:hypothetical protein
VSDPDSDRRIESTGRGVPEVPRPVDHSYGDLIDRLADRLPGEVESALLPLLSGETLRLVELSEVEQWLRGAAIRSRAGERL